MRLGIPLNFFELSRNFVSIIVNIIIGLHYNKKNSEILQDDQDAGNEETDFRIKHFRLGRIF